METIDIAGIETMTNNIIEDLYRKRMSEIEKHIVEAFQQHFGISIDDVDLREIEHIVVEGDPIESFRYRGETFLYMQDVMGDIDVCNDPTGVKFTLTTQFREV